LVGWKYELDARPTRVAKGRKQIDDCLTDACVLNGDAYGSALVSFPRGEQAHLPDKAALCRFLIEWADGTPMALATPGQQSFHALRASPRFRRLFDSYPGINAPPAAVPRKKLRETARHAR